MAYILNIMKNYKVTPQDSDNPLMYHRLIESFKYAYAFRSQIGDPADSNITKIVNNVRVEKNPQKNDIYVIIFLVVSDCAKANFG